MATVPSFKLYASDGVTLVYTFLAVIYTNAPRTEKKLIVVEGQRANGALVIDGGDKAWTLVLRGKITGTDYDTIAAAIYSMEETVDLNTAYYLKFERSSTESYSYKVKRIAPIEYIESLRTSSQEYSLEFLVNAW